MQHVLHFTQCFYFLDFIFFCRRVGGEQTRLLTCQMHVYLHKHAVERATYLCMGKENRDLPSTLWQPDVIASLIYARGDGSTCVVLQMLFFFFFPDPSPLHCTEDFFFVGLLRRDTPTSPRLKGWDIQNEEKIGFYRTLAYELFPVQQH